MIMGVTLGFAATGIVEVIEKRNPIINVNSQKDYYFSNELNLNKSNVKFAFGAMGGFDNDQPKNDPKYVKWKVDVNNNDENGEKIKTPLKFH